MQRDVEAARMELAELRGALSTVEKRESEAREEASRLATSGEEVVRKLERTESEVKIKCTRRTDHDPFENPSAYSFGYHD